MSAPGMQSSPPPMSKPYPPQTWSLGGIPEKKVDIPITAVFLALFIISAIAHMTILQINNRRGHKFLMSGLLFGFSMARITACVMRIASVSKPKNIRLQLASTIFTAAGVVILFVVNIIFTQRVFRALHPKVGWHRAFEAMVKILIALVIIMIIMVITVVIQTYHTLNPTIRQHDRDIQLLGLTYFAFAAFVPIPVVIIGLLIPRNRPVDKFGSGSWRTKIWVLLFSAVLLTFGAGYRVGCQYLPLRSQKLPIYPAMHKAAFYVANFTVEIIVMLLYAIIRVDKRFHIPNGARNGYRSNEWSKSGKVQDDESRPVSTVGPGMLSSSSIEETKPMSAPDSPQLNR